MYIQAKKYDKFILKYITSGINSFGGSIQVSILKTFLNTLDKFLNERNKEK